MKMEYMCENTLYYKIVTIFSIIACLVTGLLIYKEKYVFIVFIIFLWFLFFNTAKTMYAKDLKSIKDIKIAKAGTVYNGTILGYNEYSFLSRITNSNTELEETELFSQKIYTLKIQLDDENNTIFETPEIVYYPQKLFRDKTCKVYKNENNFYAFDFNLIPIREQGSGHVEIEKLNEGKKEDIPIVEENNDKE